LTWEATGDSELDRDLNRELLSVKAEAKDSEPDRDLNSELFSARLETEDREPDKALARALT
jgi:hypothetical protein